MLWFLWCGAGESSKDHLVAWETNCRPKEEDCLGFGNLVLKNLPLLVNGYGVYFWSLMLNGIGLFKAGTMHVRTTWVHLMISSPCMLAHGVHT